jgi:hypothetical protein
MMSVNSCTKELSSQYSDSNMSDVTAYYIMILTFTARLLLQLTYGKRRNSLTKNVRNLFFIIKNQI